MSTPGEAPRDDGEPSAPQEPEPFELRGCNQIRESIGVRADSERHLMERLETVPETSIYYHSVRCLLAQQVLTPRYPNDFAAWVATEVQDPELAEKLSLQSPFDFDEIEAYRDHLLGVLDDHLARMPFDPRSYFGRPFFFLRGHLRAVSLGVTVTSLEELRSGLQSVDESAIYYHAVEAIGRLDKTRNDFAEWVDASIGRQDLAVEMEQLDPFVLSLEGVRNALLRILEDAEGDRA